MRQGVSLLCILWLHSGGVAKQGITGTVGTKDWPRNRRGEQRLWTMVGIKMILQIEVIRGDNIIME